MGGGRLFRMGAGVDGARSEGKEVHMSMRAKHRTIGQKPTQRKGHPGGGSVMSLDASCGTADNVGYTPVIVDDSLRLRAEELDAEAAYYRRRAIQEQQALA
jgi:hypothetical protein